MRNILIIEDNMMLNDEYKAAIDHLLKLGVNVLQAYNCEEALAKARIMQISVFIIDVSLPDGNGIDLAEKLRLNYPFAPLIVATDKKGNDFRAEVQDRIRNAAFLTKPFSVKKLVAEIEYTLNALNEPKANYFKIKIDWLFQAFLADDVIKIEKIKDEKRYVAFIDNSENKYDYANIQFYAPSMEAIFLKFDDASDFIQSSRNCIINKNRRRKLSRDKKTVYLRPNDLEADVGGNFKKGIEALFE